MASTKITDKVYSVGILNPSMRIFDIVMRTDYGTSYNSFIVKGSEKTALIEVSHAEFFEQYLNNLNEVCDPSEIDYIILNHCEPDHSGALEDLLSICKNAEIIATTVGGNYLKNITNKSDLPLKIVKDGETLDLGDTTLKFLPSSFLHWPDSMFTYCEEERILFSCDVFGCHYAEPYVFDKYIAYDNHYEEALVGYYNAIFGPFKPFVLKGLDKISSLDFDYICTSHGPVLSKGNKLEHVMELYKKWSTPEKRDNKLVPVFYCSAYGNTKKIANAIVEGIKAEDSSCDTKAYDINEYDMSELSAIINSSDAFCLGSPTINSDAVAPVWNLISTIDVINNRKRKALVFGSYGWSGEAVKNLTDRLLGIKNDVFGEGLKVTFVPTSEDLENAKKLGSEFIKSV